MKCTVCELELLLRGERRKTLIRLLRTENRVRDDGIEEVVYASALYALSLRSAQDRRLEEEGNVVRLHVHAMHLEGSGGCPAVSSGRS